MHEVRAKRRLFWELWFNAWGASLAPPLLRAVDYLSFGRIPKRKGAIYSYKVQFHLKEMKVIGENIDLNQD